MKTAQLITTFVNSGFSLLSEVRNNFNRIGYFDSNSYREAFTNSLAEANGILTATLTLLERLEDELDSDKLKCSLTLGYNLLKSRFHEISDDIESRFSSICSQHH